MVQRSWACKLLRLTDKLALKHPRWQKVNVQMSVMRIFPFIKTPSTLYRVGRKWMKLYNVCIIGIVRILCLWDVGETWKREKPMNLLVSVIGTALEGKTWWLNQVQCTAPPVKWLTHARRMVIGTTSLLLHHANATCCCCHSLKNHGRFYLIFCCSFCLDACENSSWCAPTLLFWAV